MQQWCAARELKLAQAEQDMARRMELDTYLVALRTRVRQPGGSEPSPRELRIAFSLGVNSRCRHRGLDHPWARHQRAIG